MGIEAIELLKPQPLETDGGDHEKFAHWVYPKEAITNAIVTGEPCTALCGKTWVPSRAPEQFPVCPECEELRKQIVARESEG